MGAKNVAMAYAKSVTVWGGVLQWLLTLVLALLASDRPHALTIGLDGDNRWAIPLTAPVLFAVASAGLYLVLYGRDKARGPLRAALSQVAASVACAADAHSCQPMIGTAAQEAPHENPLH